MKTTSYETSKKLAEAGFKAETEFGYDKSGQIDYPICNNSLIHIKCYDLETILEALPRGLRVEGKYWELGLHFREFGKSITYNNGSIAVYLEENESLADAAARLWLKLKEMGLV